MAGVGLVVSGVNASELFDFAEIVLYEVPPFVSLFIVRNMDFPITLCGNDRLCASFLQGFAQMIGIKSLVGQQGIECEAVNIIGHSDNLTALAGQQFETNEIAQSIGEGKHFGAQSPF